LDLFREHGLDCVGLCHKFPDLDRVDELSGLLPLASCQSLRRLHDVISSILWWAGEDLTFMVLEHSSVGLADYSLLDIWRGACLCKERNFEKHAAGKVNTLEKLKVDVHVERKLTLSFKALLFWRNLVVSLNHNTLGKQLLLAPTSANLLKSSLSFIDKTGPESTKADLNKSSVEEDLAVNIECVDGLLQMRHQHHVASLVVVVV